MFTLDDLIRNSVQHALKLVQQEVEAADTATAVTTAAEHPMGANAVGVASFSTDMGMMMPHYVGCCHFDAKTAGGNAGGADGACTTAPNAYATAISTVAPMFSAELSQQHRVYAEQIRRCVLSKEYFLCFCVDVLLFNQF